MSTYTASPYGTCTHCGQVADQHHSDRRCYTTQELIARLQFAHRAGRWPGPDEGCEGDANL